MHDIKFLAPLLTLAVLCVPPAAGGLIIYDFMSGMPAGLSTAVEPGLTGSIDIDGGWAVFSGSGTGFARMVTDPITGDFLAAAFTKRTALSGTGTLGLALYYAWPPSVDSPFASVYLAGDGTIKSNIFVDSGNQDSTWAAQYPYTILFLIERTGDTVVTKYDNGTTVNVLTFTDPALAAEVRVGIFLGEAGGESVGRFDVLVIQTPDGAIPEPASAALVSGALLLLAAFRRKCRVH